MGPRAVPGQSRHGAPSEAVAEDTKDIDPLKLLKPAQNVPRNSFEDQ